MSSQQDPAVLLGRTFASRAEQLKDRVFEFYQQPAYFPELLTETPCAVIGGRGTGKTTVLRGLSFEGQEQLRQGQDVTAWPFYGVYLRINTGRVAAFDGPELDTTGWQRVFSHYVNLLLCDAALRFVQWYHDRSDSLSLLDAHAVAAVAESLGVDESNIPGDALALSKTVATMKRRFETYVNTVADGQPPALSSLGAPVDELVGRVMTAPEMHGRLFFFLLDEYENLRPQQQRVLNTLIKHAGEYYTFKIGIKELGWRAKTTLNEHEQLQAPADYAAININDRLRAPSVFGSFAMRVCQERLEAVAREAGHADRPLVRSLFPPLSEDREAELLGVNERAAEVREEIASASAAPSLDAFDRLPGLYQYLIGFWARSHDERAVEAYRDYAADEMRWNGRYGNYKHALLFTLRARRRGTRKYYAGFDTLVALAGDNIRFLVQLVEQSLREHLLEVGGRWLDEPVSPEHQTTAAHKVAQRNLVELEGLSLIGPRLTRLCVGLGRIFQVMAQDPGAHAPEVTQFSIEDLKGDLFGEGPVPEAPSRPLEEYDDQARRLLAEAITHLALIQLPATKLSGASIREYDYMLHPIFSALFSYSYRRKRKMTLSSEELLGLVNEPRRTIREILERNNRPEPAGEEELPEQMRLFDRYLRDRAPA
jgi:hypothetical protein